MAGPCDKYQVAVDALESELDAIADLLAGASPEEKADLVRQEKRIASTLVAAHKQLQSCLKSLATNVQIAGIERTQVIQYWNTPAGQGSGFAGDNSIPMIAGKPTVLRCYVDVAQRTNKFPLPTSVTGTLHIAGPSGTLDITPIGGSITAKALVQINRASLMDTLNFKIPWQLCNGTVWCTLEVHDPVQVADRDSDSFSIAFENVPLLDVHSVLIHYQGPDFFDKQVDARATSLDVLITLDYVLRTYPISGFNFDGCEVLTWTEKVATNQGFYDLDNQIGSMRAMAGSSDTYIALLPPPAGCAGVCGLGGSDVALYFADSPPEASHEIGHALGRSHTQCAVTSGGADPNYPTYNGFPQGSIGEVGFDAARIALFDPRTTFDFMSYCDPTWVSPYTYLGLRAAVYSNAGLSAPQPYIRSSPWAAESGDFYHVSVRVHREEPVGRVEVISAFHVVRRPPRWLGEAEGLKLELVDDTGQLLDVAIAVPSHLHHDRDEPFCDYTADFPRPPSLRAIRVVQEGKVLETLELAHAAPVLEITGVERVESQHGNLMRVTWRGEAPSARHAPLSYGVRFSHDGRKWRGLAVGIAETQYVIDLDLLPGGEHCRVQVVASAGFRSATAETDLFAAPCKPRLAHIGAPAQGAEFEVGQPIAFVGAGFSADSGLTRPDEVVWVSRAAGSIGIGHQITTTELPIGHHRVTMYVPDGMGGEASANVDIQVKMATACDCGHRNELPKPHGRCPRCGH